MSAIVTIRTVMGIAIPEMPSGYPEPSRRSWWEYTTGSVLRMVRMGRSSSWPTVGCSSMTARSSAVRAPGLRRIASGMTILPRS